MSKIRSQIPSLARYALGVILVVFGLNGFLSFLPMPPLPGAAGAFMGGLAASGYFFPMLKGLEIVLGLMLLARILVPLALVILAPITFNILAFHVFLAPDGLPLALVLVGLQGYVAWCYRGAFVGLFRQTSGAGEQRVVHGGRDSISALSA